MSQLEQLSHKPVVLVGLMGAGKTTVGRRLAKRLGHPFVDSDQKIEHETRHSITELIEQFGEPYFRDLERKTIARLLEKAPQVIATGGGAYMNDETRGLIKEKAVSIWLRADLDVLHSRVMIRDNRPLLKGGDKREILARLMEQRYPIYAEADITIDSNNGQHTQIVESIIEALGTMPNTIHDTLTVSLGERSYPIHIGEDLLAAAGELLRPILPRPRVFILTDEHVGTRYDGILGEALARAGIRHSTLMLPPGESTKSFARLEQVMGWLLDQRPERKDTLIALGGGVIGDLTGFAASILMRGAGFVQIPTTLLAQVDSSVGGKTGINLPQGKNLVGSFYQPRAVLADTGVLATLPPREMRSGFAEVIKYGLIDRPDFFAWLEGNHAAVLAGDAEALTFAIRTSCEAKAAVVAEDEREGGKRALLNLGHTFGHALEAETGYSNRLLHGEAVAIGMAMAFRFSVKLGLCPPEDAARLEALLRHCDMPVMLKDIPHDWSAEALLNHMALDKKVSDGTLTLILANGIGQSFITRETDTARLRDFLEGECAATR